MKYICKNPNCEDFDTEIEIFKERIVISNGNVISTGGPCPKCNHFRIPINPEGMTTYITGIDGPKR